MKTTNTLSNLTTVELLARLSEAESIELSRWCRDNAAELANLAPAAKQEAIRGFIGVLAGRRQARYRAAAR